MQVPIRKPGKYTHQKPDPFISQQKYNELLADLERLKQKRPHAASEVSRLAELGDFSENAEYQLAKGRLRGINNAILKLEQQIIAAEIIEPKKPNGTVQLGSEVVIETGGVQKTYRILGSEESRPEENIISHHSPLGSALMGKSAGDSVTIAIGGKEKVFQIIAVK